MGGLESKLFLAVGAIVMFKKICGQKKVCVTDLWVPFQDFRTNKVNRYQPYQQVLL